MWKICESYGSPFDEVPGVKSINNAVPAAVPSVFHNSLPCIPSSAEKITILSVAVIAVLETMLFALYPEEVICVLISLTIIVPEAVPSLFHNSVPWVPSLAE